MISETHLQRQEDDKAAVSREGRNDCPGRDKKHKSNGYAAGLSIRASIDYIGEFLLLTSGDRLEGHNSTVS